MAWTSPISANFLRQRSPHNKRWAGIGKSIRVVVFVTLGLEAVSVISMRPASKNERKLYAER
jgi:uncharacterized protein